MNSCRSVVGAVSSLHCSTLIGSELGCHMPARSKKQRIAIAIAEHNPSKLYARNQGMLGMTHEQMHDFAATPETDLPETAPSATAPKKPRTEAVPGLMQTRNDLRSIRNASIAHIRRGSR